MFTVYVNEGSGFRPYWVRCQSFKTYNEAQEYAEEILRKDEREVSIRKE